MTSLAVDAPAPARPAPPVWRHLPGLDGVRAIAVVAVLLFHADPSWLPGGFLGVDVFFTLSGFLITSLLLAELDVSGRLRFGRFYLRRARRLLPALFAVLVATAILAATVAQDAADRVREDAVAAFFYVTNWWYVLHGTNYWDFTGRPPLLQHLWSLAVEEQFYLVWPVLLLALWKIGRVRGVLVGAVLGALGSTALMAWYSVQNDIPAAADASRVYFGTDTHAMTLLVGAAVAAVWSPGRLNSSLTDRGRTVTALLGVLGLAGLVAIFLEVDETTSWLFRGGFLVLAVAAALVVVGAAVVGTWFSVPLGRQPLRWIGERSYGIYLWHWPIFMVLRPGVDVDADGWTVQVARFALTLAAAELSYRFVEMPVRRGALGRAWNEWLEIGGLGFLGRVSIAVVTAVGVVVFLGVGLVTAHEPTVEEALGGVTEVGTGTLTPAPSPSASPVVGASPSALPPGQDAFGLPTTAVGDSVMLAARQALIATFPRVTVDAAISRQSDVIYDRVRARLYAGQLGRVVVIHAGTNGTIKESDLVSLLSVLKDRARVVLVTCRAPRPWIAQSNAAIWAAARRFPGGNVRVADWNALSAGHRDWFYDDLIHTKAAGAAQYAALIRQTMAS